MNCSPVKKVLGLMVSMWIFGCTQSEPAMVKQLEKSISAAEAHVESIETALKNTPEQNQGLTIKLTQDKQLAISRLERLKENLFSVAPHKKDKDKPTEQNGHSGGH